MTLITFSEFPVGTSSPIYYSAKNVVYTDGGIKSDSSNPTSPVLAGSTDSFLLPVTFTFKHPVYSVSLDVGYFDSINNNLVDFANGGSLIIKTFVNTETGIEHFEYSDIRGIGSVTVSSIQGEINGFGVDNINYSDPILNGSAGNDNLTGTSDADYINGDLGNDVINGAAGSDVISGGGGNDFLSGGDGNDSITSSFYWGGNSSGLSNIFGGDGNDSILANGYDSVDGGAGHDYIVATSNGYGAHVFVNAGSGNDVVVGGSGGDTIYGGDGDDSIQGNGGSDILYGGAGNDVLYGGLDTDRYEGDAGNDIFQFSGDVQVGVMDQIADFTAGQDHFVMPAQYAGSTYFQDTTNGVLISASTDGSYWGAMVYGTHDVSAVKNSTFFFG